jgi:putative DNA primase/helicase
MSTRTHRTMDAKELSKATKRAKKKKAKAKTETGSKRHAGNGAAGTPRGPSWANQCTRTPAGTIDGSNVRNVLIALRHAPEWRDVLAFDAFALRHIIGREIPSAGQPVTRRVPRMLEDSDVVAALEWFHAQGMVRLRKTMLYDAMLLHARDDGRFHPVLDFFAEMLAGDEPPEVLSAVNGDRIDPDLPIADTLSMVLAQGFGADDMRLNRAISRAFMVSMVRRVRHPGCQADHVLVLKGDQGIGKSSGLALLVGREWFTDHLPDLHSKDALIQLHGKVLIEWAELGAMKRAQIEKTKAFVTSRIDTFRPPFERAAIDVPRTCNFAGTTNDDDFLDDASGGRRFWPVECEQVDLGWIAANRALIWRLAAQAEALGEDNWVAATDLQGELIEHQADAQRADVWEDCVLDYVAERALDGVRINADFLFSVLGIAAKDQHNGHKQRIASILKRAGWKRGKRHRADDQARRWLPPSVRRRHAPR